MSAENEPSNPAAFIGPLTFNGQIIPEEPDFGGGLGKVLHPEIEAAIKERVVAAFQNDVREALSQPDTLARPSGPIPRRMIVQAVPANLNSPQRGHV